MMINFARFLAMNKEMLQAGGTGACNPDKVTISLETLADDRLPGFYRKFGFTAAERARVRNRTPMQVDLPTFVAKSSDVLTEMGYRPQKRKASGSKKVARRKRLSELLHNTYLRLSRHRGIKKTRSGG